VWTECTAARASARAMMSRHGCVPTLLQVIKQVYSLEGIVHDASNFAELVAMVKEQLVRSSLMRHRNVSHCSVEGCLATVRST
jgi:hypothetical protein